MTDSVLEASFDSKGSANRKTIITRLIFLRLKKRSYAVVDKVSGGDKTLLAL